MPDLADLYPGYAAHWIDTSIGKIFARVGGSGPPLLLLHGHPQSNVMWHRVAPELAAHFTLVIADLPGYGWSAVPEADADHAPYTKRAMAIAMIQVMEALGFARFRLAVAIDVDADGVAVFGDVAGHAERHGAVRRGAVGPGGNEQRATNRRRRH